MKKLFAILAVLALTATYTFAATSTDSKSGNFTAFFFCPTTVTNVGNTTVNLGNYFVGNNQPVTAASPVITFGVSYSQGAALALTGSVTNGGSSADITVLWQLNAVNFNGVNTSSVNINATDAETATPNTYGCLTGTVTATAQTVSDMTAEAVTYTATLTATATI